MSLSQDRPTNPAKFFLKIKSGAVSYYDKDTQENIAVPTPFEFIVLDQLATIKGWSDADESGFWSNEVRSIGKDIVNVRTSKGTKESGIWRDIKGSPELAGAKYNTSVYIAHQSRNGMIISNIAFSGASLKAWIEFSQKNRVNNCKVVLSDWLDAKKGRVEYQVPVFEAMKMTEAEREEAIELDKQLQVYLNEYFNYASNDAHGEEKQEVIEDVALEDIDDKPIDLSEIPF